MRKNNSQLTVHSLHKKAAFTLAEMMVVMLILTICLAAFAPLMTKKKPMDATGIWQYAANGSDIYYGLGKKNSVMIGQKEKTANDFDARLILSNESTTSNQPHIAFKNGNTNLGHLMVKSSNFVFNGPYTSAPFPKDVIFNTAMGYHALVANTDGSYNTAIGAQALSSNTDGLYNTAVGYCALTNNIGSSSGTNQSGKGNTAVGYWALGANKGDVAGNQSSYNTAVGHSALSSNTTATGNTAVGAYALNHNTVGSYNTALGYEALQAVIGRASTSRPDSGDANTAIGYKALGGSNNKGDTYPGTRVASDNTAVGYQTLLNNSTGSANVAVGSTALETNTSGSNNIAIGYGAQQKNTTGGANVAVGVNTLYSNEKGSSNVAIGHGACLSVKGSNKTCIGMNSGPASGSELAKDTNTEKIIFLGDADTTVYIPGNLVVGKYAMLGIAGKDYYTGMRMLDSSHTDRTRGYAYGAWHQASSNNWQFTKTDVTASEYKCYNPLSSTFTVYDCFGQWYGPSDRRLKNINGENKSGLEQIRALQVFDFTFKKDKTKTPRVGVMAQDLQKIFPNAVTKSEDGYLMIRQEDMFYAAINAIKQLDRLVSALIGEVKVIGFKLNTLIEQEHAKDLKIKELEQRIEKLEKALQ